MAPLSSKVFLFATVASAQQELPSFESFIELHARSYHKSSVEYSVRKELYEERKADSEKHNNVAGKSWTAGVNKLWDWTEAELKTLRGWDGSMQPSGGGSRSVRQHSAFLQADEDMPKEKFWTYLQTGQKIRNQGACGSCWAVAAETVLMAHTEIFTGTARTFSAQQIVECTANPNHCGGEGGCKGATAELAMEWVLKNGCAQEHEVPYLASDGQCTRTPSASASFLDTPSADAGASFGMTGWETLPKNEYAPLLRALAEKGPVAVSAAADQWFNYDNGIFNGCGKDAVVDHAVVAMGYGEDPETGKKFWVIQNSWGGNWGEQGRIRLERHVDGDYCGMDNDPQKGIACKGETAPVPVCGMCGVLFDSVVPHFSR